MINKKNKISYDNSGSALIMALVVSAVLMVLCFSLLAVAYSFFLAQNKNARGDVSERETFYSAIEIFEQELMDGGHKIFEDDINQETVNANMDDQLFGTKLVESIFKYCNEDLGYNISLKTIAHEKIDSVPKWERFDSEKSDILNEDAKEEYLNSVSRFFDLTCYGAYKFDAQMYWEFDSSNSDSNLTDLDRMKGILLHAVYRLKKSDEILIENERVYRLNATMGAAALIPSTEMENNENNGTETETEENNEPKIYTIKFGVVSNNDIYKVDTEFFSGLKESTTNPKYPCIEFTQSEMDQDENLFEKYPYLTKWTWYTTSKKTEQWDGKPLSLFSVPDGNNTTLRIARTDWNNKVPVRIKFVINGYYIDLDMYNYSYIKFVNNATGSQIFTSADIRNELKNNNSILEICGIDITNEDNIDTIIWKLKDGNTYYKFFDQDGYPIINHTTDIKKVYYVYATFPSYYTDNTFSEFKSGVKIPQYNKNKTITLDNLCSYTKYSFERIIG